MKITYLGTGGFDSIPALFCSCETCERARKTGGKNLRGHSQALINDDLLIDLPPETHYRANLIGLNLSKIKNFLITHTHPDHFYPTAVNNLHPNFSNVKDVGEYKFYGSVDLKAFGEANDTMGRADIVTVKAFEPFKVGRYTVTALKGNHPTDNPFMYIISDGEKTMLYAHDTGYFLDENIKYMKNSNVRLDFISLDCTKGAKEELDYPWHQCIGRNVKTRQTLLECGVIDENTKIVLNHFSHNGESVLYEELCPVAEKHGFLVSYDGMTAEF